MNNVFISYDHMLFLQDFKETNKHKHMMKHLTLTREGYMKCELSGEQVNTCGYILGENVEHQRFGESAESIKMVFLFEPSSSLSKQADKVLGEQEYLLISRESVKMIFNMWNEKLEGKTSEEIKEKYNEVINEIFKLCGLKRSKKIVSDNRIKTTLDIIDKKEDISDVNIEEIINNVHLSKSRFLHLFKENIGISFKDFILTKKFIKTWTYLAKGENITEACIHGGFFDSAHYTHFMSECFGMATKSELKSINGIYLVDEF